MITQLGYKEVCVEEESMQNINKPTYPKRILFFCNSDGEKKVERHIRWLPCEGHIKGGDEYCRYDTNMPFLRNFENE